MADQNNRSTKRSVIKLDYEEIPINNEPEEQKSSKQRVETASSSTVSGKKSLTLPQLRMLRGSGQLTTELSMGRIENSDDPTGPPPTVSNMVE